MAREPAALGVSEVPSVAKKMPTDVNHFRPDLPVRVADLYFSELLSVLPIPTSLVTVKSLGVLARIQN